MKQMFRPAFILKQLDFCIKVAMSFLGVKCLESDLRSNNGITLAIHSAVTQSEVFSVAKTGVPFMIESIPMTTVWPGRIFFVFTCTTGCCLETCRRKYRRGSYQLLLQWYRPVQCTSNDFSSSRTPFTPPLKICLVMSRC